MARHSQGNRYGTNRDKKNKKEACLETESPNKRKFIKSATTKSPYISSNKEA
eukprot:TRINITY_DN507_c0_g1_i1.p2 TRINITY_DN507_c0_g1~~TRINITY_DN507_c0_g1_i1.p2  ORF type:complete len:52 (-),score=5.89 TRINITY_DN507_c0_g1_i1:41-196(-)